MESSDDRSRSWRGVAYVLTAAALFSVNGSVSKALLGDTLSSTQLVELRCWIAAAGFLAIAVARSPGSIRLTRAEIPFVLAYGVIGVAMVQWLYFVAIARMPVSISLLIEFTAPVMIALWVRFVRHEPLRGRVWLALLLTLGGLALVARVWEGITLDRIGLAAAAAAAVALAVYYLLGEHGVHRRDPWSLAAWGFGTAGLMWAIVAPPWDFPWSRLGDSVALPEIGVAGPAWLFATYVVLLGTLAPFGLTLLGLRHIGAARVGLIATAEPPLAGLVAWPVLGEALLPVQVIGAAVVMAGIVLAETARMPSRTAPATPETLTLRT